MKEQYRRTIKDLVQEINDEEMLKVICKIVWSEWRHEVGDVY